MAQRQVITRRRLLVALIALATAVAVALVLGATRLLHHGSRSSSRTAVAAYIDNVDLVERHMGQQLFGLLLAYRSFAVNGRITTSTAKLAEGERTLRTLDARLGAIPAPSAAAKLRVLLLRLVRAETAVAHELVGLARFLPRFSALAADVTAANAKLGHDLAAAPSPKAHNVKGTPKQIAAAQAAYAAEATRAAAEQAAAVDAYDRTIERLLREMQAVTAPALVEPVRGAEVRSLQATVTAGAALAAELRTQNRSRVPELARALSEAARLSSSVASQRAEIAAVKEYDARVRQISKDQGRVQVEIARLQRQLH